MRRGAIRVFGIPPLVRTADGPRSLGRPLTVLFGVLIIWRSGRTLSAMPWRVLVGQPWISDSGRRRSMCVGRYDRTCPRYEG